MLKSTMMVGGAALELVRMRAGGTSHRVAMRGMVFEPAHLHVARGDTVTFVNSGTADHTASAADGSFDTGRLAAGQSASVVIRGAGTVAYSCRIHPRMTGRITAG